MLVRWPFSGHRWKVALTVFRLGLLLARNWAGRSSDNQLRFENELPGSFLRTRPVSTLAPQKPTPIETRIQQLGGRLPPASPYQLRSSLCDTTPISIPGRDQHLAHQEQTHV